MATVDKYNHKNPAVKRILQEVKEMQSDPSDDFMRGYGYMFNSNLFKGVGENIFEWQFAIRGPNETEFEGGIYHGRIQLPSEYPFKPPSFLLLTPNGRFETQTKICLSISNHHPEHWQPSWSVRTALVALIAFMPTPPSGALRSLDYTKEERCKLAVKSREAPPTFGSSDRQKLIDEIHDYMLSKAPPVPQNQNQSSEEQPTETEAEPQGSEIADGARISEPPNEAAANVNVDANVNPHREDRQVRTAVTSQVRQQQRRAPRAQPPADDRLLTWAAVGLTVAIVFLLLKKLVKSSGYGAIFMSES